MPTVYQADALWLDVEIPLFASIDATWANWTGSYEISATEASTPIATGTVTRSTTEGVMNLRLNTSDVVWTAIAVGVYKLMIEIANSTKNYREEHHFKLTIRPQGIS
jgi:hypothetical protein